MSTKKGKFKEKRKISIINSIMCLFSEWLHMKMEQQSNAMKMVLTIVHQIDSDNDSVMTVNNFEDINLIDTFTRSLIYFHNNLLLIK